MIPFVKRKKYAILSLLTGILFVAYMVNRLKAAANPYDPVAAFEPFAVLFSLFLHIPFFLTAIVASLFYFGNKDSIGSILLGSGSVLYLFLHQFVFTYSHVSNDYFFITPLNIPSISLFPLFGAAVALVCYLKIRQRRIESLHQDGGLS